MSELQRQNKNSQIIRKSRLVCPDYIKLYRYFIKIWQNL